MRRLTADLIPELLEQATGSGVTIYMPTHLAHSPPNMSEDQLRYKNLRSKALGIIHNIPEVNNDAAEAIDRQLAAIQEDLTFWEEQKQGLAVFANPKTLTAVQLPIDSGEYVAVDERFHVSPLLGLLSLMTGYFVLLISEKEPLLFLGDSYGLKRIDIPLPVSGRSGSLTLAETKLTGRLSPRRADSQPSYFGTNAPVTNEDERLQFFRLVDRAVREETQANRPLILAGTEADIADYRNISSYPRILDGQLPNATTETDIKRLFPEADSIIHNEVIDPKQRQTLARFQRLLEDGSGLASNETAAIEDAANKGRIDTLLLRMMRLTADTLGNSGRNVPKLTFLPDEQMAVADYVAVQAWRAGATISPLVDTTDTPTETGTVMSTIFRY